VADRVRVNQAELQRLLRGRNGPVARDLSRRAIRVESAAKLNASGRPGPRVQTGRLRSSISWTLGVDGRGLYAVVGTNVVYAKWVELGSDRAPPYPFLRPALRAARTL
jgi:hypothetical protein